MTTPEVTVADIARFWGHEYTFSHDPDAHPDRPYAAERVDGQGTVRASTPGHLLDAIKDDSAARLSPRIPAPRSAPEATP